MTEKTKKSPNSQDPYKKKNLVLIIKKLDATECKALLDLLEQLRK